ncbi:MAG: hypothetical protein ABS62_05305 [Microbacterium sp. SCN 70-200]|uniref:hypothetical protein n=1 Tax=unclassified Microbacterium TaxID=2609290 RepID=UPI00086DC45C|nr:MULTISPECIES: hypothetical protein [unclassified Microbacterium]MBN9215933.1 hypothetical protein [Microbacterium sp.]ODT41870.1 MAG: hypothetical protein ABS62_05305 [Microbacterium sp. SCN 70-200]OJV84559.1 MAG: hypothetical protein BGO46_06550 [Microbacterium sp. 70-16]
MTDFPALLRRRLAASSGLYRDFAAQLTPELLAARLPGVRSAPVWNQLWCVIAARESYERWARAGAWQGFECTLTETGDPGAVHAALESSGEAMDAWVAGLDAEDEASWAIALHLLEHETQHHGQLIRYLYGVPITLPRSWIEAYALDEV